MIPKSYQSRSEERKRKRERKKKREKKKKRKSESENISVLTPYFYSGLKRESLFLVSVSSSTAQAVRPCWHHSEHTAGGNIQDGLIGNLGHLR